MNSKLLDYCHRFDNDDFKEFIELLKDDCIKKSMNVNEEDYHDLRVKYYYLDEILTFISNVNVKEPTL